MAVEDLNSNSPVADSQADGASNADSPASKTPEIDGSIDALVANLRAAREQFAEVLERSESNFDASQSKVA